MMHLSKTILCTVLWIPLAFLHAQDIEYDKQLGAEGARTVLTQYGIDDSKTSEYVKKVGDNLAGSLTEPIFEYQFNIADTPEPNAFALPGGYVYVTRGLLAMVNTEDELAGVMGHEIIHAYRRHSIKQMKKSILPSILKIPGNIIGAFSPNLGSIINAPSNLFIANYSRKHEKESDELGVGLSAAAGYDPYALAPILERLSAEVELLTGQEEKKGYFSDHPYTPDRVDNINQIAGSARKGTDNRIAQSDNEFLQQLDGMWFGDNPAYGTFNKSRFLHPTLKIGLQFPENWKTINSAQAVGGFSKDNKAVFVLSIPQQQMSPEAYSKLVIEKLQKEYKLEPVKAEPITINGLNGYTVHLYKEQKKQESIGINLTWLASDGNTFQLASAYTDDNQEVTKKIENSFSALSNKEVANIIGHQIKIIAPKEGESLEALCKRTQNTWDVPFTAMANGLSTSQPLSSKRKIKISVEKKFMVEDK